MLTDRQKLVSGHRCRQCRCIFELTLLSMTDRSLSITRRQCTCTKKTASQLLNDSVIATIFCRRRQIL